MTFENPTWGQQRASNELRKQGVLISCVRSVLQGHDLEVVDKRLKVLEVRVVQDGLIFTKAQMIAMERKEENR